MNVKNGVLDHASRNTIDAALADSLSRICDEIDVGVFYPIVYRVDRKTIGSKRFEKAGSGALGSFEYLIRDLQESEIADILFLDYEGDVIIKDLVKSEYAFFRAHHSARMPPKDILRILEARVGHGGPRRLPASKPRTSSGIA